MTKSECTIRERLVNMILWMVVLSFFFTINYAINSSERTRLNNKLVERQSLIIQKLEDGRCQE